MSAPEPLSAEQEREIIAQWHRDNPPPSGPPDPPRKVCLDCGAVETWNFITQRLNAHIGKDGRRCPGRYRRPEPKKSEVERLREQAVHLAGRLGEAHEERDAAQAEAARLRTALLYMRHLGAKDGMGGVAELMVDIADAALAPPEER